MNLIFVFSKIEKGVVSYISDMTPISESTNLKDAMYWVIDTDAYDEAIADTIYTNYGKVCEAMKDFYSIQIYKETLDIPNLTGTIEVIKTPLRIKVDLDPAMSTPDIEKAVFDFGAELTPNVAAIAMSLALSAAGPKGPAGGTSPTTGTASGADIDKIINYINTKTKGTVVSPKESLDDYVCGDLLKDELQEIVDFFKNEALYKSKGIQLPKGVLFKGPPGTGKTYAARCIAGSVDCYFITCTASSLQGMYIGSGAENIRNLFEGAKDLSEASGKGVLIFIDELDSFGSRESHAGSASDESDRTLNQLLAEMSGFEDVDKLMVIAATNYPERLDDALMRSGRFSRQINIDVPESEERQHMLEFYFNKIKMDIEDATIVELSNLTEGMTPADIKEIANESGILTIRKKLSTIHLNDINEAINKVITKSIRNPDKAGLNYDMVAVHEVGHVIAELLYNKSCPLKVTNYSYGNAGGFTQSSNKLNSIPSKEVYLNRVKELLGGRVAEKVILKEITTGASDDLKRAKRMLMEYYQVYHFEPYVAKDLEQIVLDKLDALQFEMEVDFDNPVNKNYILNLKNELVSNRILYAKDILRICGDLIITEDIF